MSAFSRVFGTATAPAQSPAYVGDDYEVVGLPELSATDTALFRSRLHTALRSVPAPAGGFDLRLRTGASARSAAAEESEAAPQPAASAQPREKRSPSARRDGEEHETPEHRAAQYSAVKPRHRFDRLVVSDAVREDILAAVAVLAATQQVFVEWGLEEIEPFPRTALNFHGPAGVGKTLAAHAVADYLGKRILLTSYADVESKYVGDGPKNVAAIFAAAEREDAVLFIDEADSLLGKRITNVSQGSDQAINSMRSQLLIALEQFKGVVIFATNLVTNYDAAFESRLRSVAFTMPDAPTRGAIWSAHLPKKLPVFDLDIGALADVDDVCGRDIKNAVVDAAVRAHCDSKPGVSGPELLAAILRLKAARPTKARELEAVELAPAEQAALEARISAAVEVELGSPAKPTNEPSA